MVTDAIEQIESFTSADYVGALRRVKPTESQLEMLCVHLAAPDQTITVRHRARTGLSQLEHNESPLWKIRRQALQRVECLSNN